MSFTYHEFPLNIPLAALPTLFTQPMYHSTSFISQFYSIHGIQLIIQTPETHFVAFLSISFCATSLIITLVWYKKARFDSKMHGSTQKSPVWHKNARFDTKMPFPACASWHCHCQTSPSCEKYFFQFYTNILFLRTNRKMKMKLYWYEFIISIQYHYENWNVIILFCLWWP